MPHDVHRKRMASLLLLQLFVTIIVQHSGPGSRSSESSSDEVPK